MNKGIKYIITVTCILLPSFLLANEYYMSHNGVTVSVKVTDDSLHVELKNRMSKSCIYLTEKPWGGLLSENAQNVNIGFVNPHYFYDSNAIFYDVSNTIFALEHDETFRYSYKRDKKKNNLAIRIRYIEVFNCENKYTNHRRLQEKEEGNYDLRSISYFLPLCSENQNKNEEETTER